MTAPDARPIRTFHGRHGRTSARMRRILEDLGPRRALAARPATRRALALEVGCGHGEAAVAFAADHPDVDLLAIDVHTPGIVHLLEVAERAGLANLFVERGDALEALRHRIPTDGLVAVHLFFPDPWPKSRHHKRRFVRPDVVDLLADRLAPGGDLLVATDVPGYSDSARRHLSDHPAFADSPGGRPGWRPVTRYEAAARRAGRPVFELGHRRR